MSHAAGPAAITGNGLLHAAAEAATPEATEAATAAPRRIAGTPTHGYEPRGRNGGVRQELAAGVAMAKTTPPLTAQGRVILFCTATGVSHAAVGITAHAMQSMAIKGFIIHDRESGAYALTDSGRAALLAILGDAGLT
jgi:hypothetical protein